MRAAQQVDQRAGGGDGLQAAAVAAAADDPVGVDEHVAELARQAGAAAVQAAVEDQPGADAGGDLQVDEVARVAAGAERGLGERAEVRVVVDHHRDVEALAQLGGGGHADPARQDRGGADGAVALVDRARQAHAGADHGLARDARVGQRLDHELGGHLEALVAS